MEKSERQDTIRELIRRNEVSTQDQLQDLLHVEGCEIVQSTLSRDLREIGVVKEDGIYIVADRHPDRPGAGRRLATTIRDDLTSVDAGGNLVTLKLAAGVDAVELVRRIESAGLPSVVAAAPCTDTVLVVARTPGYARDLVRLLRSRPRRGRRRE
jgi:transcriptional regulator of arginine metabolism